MKRPASEISADRPKRQPQVSCHFCRVKKLKCNRQHPCSNCSSRGLSCDGPPEVFSQSTPPDAILERLRRLEQAVFGDPSTHQQDLHHASIPADIQDNPYLTARQLESDLTREDSLVSTQSDRFSFSICSIVEMLHNSADSPAGVPGASAAEGLRLIYLPTKDEALLLSEIFRNRVDYLYPVVHGPTVKAILLDFYARLSHGQPFRPAHAALLLSIFAASAYIWDQGPDDTIEYQFLSSSDAAQASALWRKSTLDILEHSRRSTSGSIEDVQATVIISYLIQSIEGISPRLRTFNALALVISRDLSFHRVDSLLDMMNNASHEVNMVDTEIKRRLWWHITSTDWLLAFMGGPQEGIYSVNPKHMKVSLPLNLNDEDLINHKPSSAAPSLSIPTTMSYCLQRIRLAKICREIVDSIPYSLGSLEDIDYNQVLALDRLFGDLFADLPPFYQFENLNPQSSTPNVFIQACLVQLGAHSRRSRLHRSFLTRGARSTRYAQSRRICLSSAHTVVSVAHTLQNAAVPVSSHRLGTVVQHTFMASMVLAMELCFNQTNDQEEEPAREDFNTACHILSVAAEESAVSASLLRRLTGILHKYRVPLKGLSEQESTDAAGNVVEELRNEPTHSPWPGTASMSGSSNPNEQYAKEADVEAFDAFWQDIMETGSFKAMDWDMLFTDLDMQCASD